MRTEAENSILTGLACGALVVAAVTLLVYPLQDLDPGVSSGVLNVPGVLLVSIPDPPACARARVLAAADHERRRVVRDLHDGAQQRLVHTVIKLARRTIQRRQDPAPLVDEALQHAEQANTELRELAHGILPAALTRGGLRTTGGCASTARPAAARA